MIEEHPIVAQLLLVNLYLSSLLVNAHGGIYRSVTTQVFQLIGVQLSQLLLIQVLSLDGLKLFGPFHGLSLSCTPHANDPLFVNLSEHFQKLILLVH